MIATTKFQINGDCDLQCFLRLCTTPPFCLLICVWLSRVRSLSVCTLATSLLLPSSPQEEKRRKPISTLALDIIASTARAIFGQQKLVPELTPAPFTKISSINNVPKW